MAVYFNSRPTCSRDLALHNPLILTVIGFLWQFYFAEPLLQNLNSVLGQEGLNLQTDISSAQASKGAQRCQHNLEMTHPSSAPDITTDSYYITCSDHILSAAVVVQSLSRIRLFGTPWTAARQASLSFAISWSLSTYLEKKNKQYSQQQNLSLEMLKDLDAAVRPLVSCSGSHDD